MNDPDKILAETSLVNETEGGNVSQESVPLGNENLPGDYDVIELLGEGGFGRVLKVTNKTVSRIEAVKILRLAGDGSDRTHIERLQREAAAAAKLDHPNIVKAYRLGTCTTGAPFIAYEFVDGMTLKDYLKSRTRIPYTELRRIFVQILEGLACAHKAGLVHRDIKPANVMLAAGEEPQAKILDFGIVAFRGTDQARTLTEEGSLLGSPDYMSPEQCRGQRDVDARSDVYSVGCMLYEAVCGAPPFTGDSPVHTLYRHINEQAERPSRKRAGVPADLEDIILMSLSKLPDQRPASAALMRDAILEMNLEAEAIPEKKPRMWFLFAAVLCLLVAAGEAVLPGGILLSSSNQRSRSLRDIDEELNAPQMFEAVNEEFAPRNTAVMQRCIPELQQIIDKSTDPGAKFCAHVILANFYAAAWQASKLLAKRASYLGLGRNQLATHALKEYNDALKLIKLPDGTYPADAIELLRKAAAASVVVDDHKTGRSRLDCALAAYADRKPALIQQPLPVSRLFEYANVHIMLDLSRLDLQEERYKEGLETAEQAMKILSDAKINHGVIYYDLWTSKSHLLAHTAGSKAAALELAKMRYHLLKTPRDYDEYIGDYVTVARAFESFDMYKEARQTLFDAYREGLRQKKIDKKKFSKEEAYLICRCIVLDCLKLSEVPRKDEWAARGERIKTTGIVEELSDR